MGNTSSTAPSAKPVAEPSSSACVTQGITAVHDFQVNNFSLLQGMGVGEFISSRSFHVGGYEWSISLYPDGHDARYKHHVSSYLQPEGGGRGAKGEKSVRARFSFTVLGKNGKVWHSTVDADHTFRSGDDRGMGWPNFVPKTSWRFRRLLRNNDDGFTVRCVVTVIRDPRVVAVVVPEPSVVRDLASMLGDGDGADVTFLVGGKSFPAHRCVLAARSPVFRAELFGPKKDKAATLVWVDDMEPSVFEALLHFVYTDTLPGNVDDGADDDKGDRNNVAMQQHLLAAADRYGLDRLKAMCEDKLCHFINAETVCTSLTLAEQHHCLRLKDECMRFFVFASRDVLRSIMKTAGFKHLVKSCPLLVEDIVASIEIVNGCIPSIGFDEY